MAAHNGRLKVDRKAANRLWREVSRGAPDSVPTVRMLHEFAQRVEALTIADFEARARKHEPMFSLGGPAKVFDACADTIRAGDSVEFAMENYSLAWAPNG